jgi:deazaflavin-dependent oxidoreductase (nitroreductase family)
MAGERVRKRRLAKGLNKHVLNPPIRRLITWGIPLPGMAILETIGRKSGQPRRTPVTDGRHGDVFWIVAEHGFQAGYVRNIQEHPQVRLKVGRRWLEGTALILPEDDPLERLAEIRRRPAARMNGGVVLAMATELLVVRVDLLPPAR